MTEDYLLLEQRLDYRFVNRDQLVTALTHRSYANEKGKGEHNERLEFLGDAVLDLCVGHLLMVGYPNMSEGELSKARAAIVSEQALAELASSLGLGEWLFLGKGELQSGGRHKASLLADACEAVIAAVYLDGGFDAAFQLVERLFEGRLHAIQQAGSDDFKTLLQERLQAIAKQAPTYALLSERGPDHEKTFEVAVYLGDRELGRGTGKTKKEAEQQAAKQALEQGNAPSS